MNNFKTVCILDSDNYFKGTSIVFKDPKNKDNFAMMDNAYDIPNPNIDNENIKAKWNFDNEEWEYENNEITNVNFSENQNPMYYFRLIRLAKLKQVDDYIANKIENDNFEYDAELLQYKDDIYNLPLKIENGEIDEPVIVEDLSNYNITKNPEDMIIFNHWPQYTFRD